jgi:hypothetical protein
MLPLSRFARQGLKISRPCTFSVYFAGLGLGFIMIEIVLIQRFLLFLGEPIYTFSVVGMPFPIGLRVVAVEAPTFISWAWGVNGFFTVFGSIGASILGMAFGFTAVLAISGACYLIALSAMIIAIAHSTHEPTPTYSGSPNALLFG